MLATFSRAGLRSSAWLPGLPALAGGMRMLCTKVTETKTTVLKPFGKSNRPM